METFVDEPMEFPQSDGTVWKPRDVHDASGLPTTLRDGLTFSKNTITAQLMQRVTPGRVAEVAYAMGVRQSKLDAVPSLALGTSPVTLKEMVSAYGTLANSGSYVEPVLVTAVQNRAGATLEQFQPAAAQQGLSSRAAQTLLDVMRGVVEKGTGAGVRSRYGLKGDLAGKTGTTQDNTDGWFILMHPNLVGGAWVGFNDNRITMGDAWGQGARNALHIVGDFFQASVKEKLVDPKARFSAPRDTGAENPLVERLNDWLGSATPNGTLGGPADPSGQQQQVILVPSPPSNAPLVLSDAPAVAGGQPQVLEPPQREGQWFPQRPRAAPEYQQSPGLSPEPERQRRLVIRVPNAQGVEERRETAELGAGPARPRLDAQPESWPQPRPEPRADPRPEFQPDMRPPLRPESPPDGGIRILREVTPPLYRP